MVWVQHWGRLSEEKIQQETGIKKVKLMNDFVANGYGIVNFKHMDLDKVFEPSYL